MKTLWTRIITTALGALVALSLSPLAVAHISDAMSKMFMSDIAVKDALLCTPAWVHEVSPAEHKWMLHEIHTSKAIRHQVEIHLLFSTDVMSVGYLIRRNHQWLRTHYGSPGYERHEAALAKNEHLMRRLNRQKRDQPDSGLCAYTPHMYLRLNQRYLHILQQESKK